MKREGEGLCASPPLSLYNTCREGFMVKGRLKQVSYKKAMACTGAFGGPWIRVKADAASSLATRG